MRSTAIVGTAEECREEIRKLETAGVDQLVVLPALGTHEAYARRFASEIIEQY